MAPYSVGAAGEHPPAFQRSLPDAVPGT